MARRAPAERALERPRRRSHSSSVVCRGASSPDSISARSSLSRPWRSATTLCWWIVSRFSWRAETKLAPSSCGKRATHAREHLAHAVLDEARAAHVPFPRPRPRRRASSARRSPRTCSPRRSPAALSRRSPRRSPRCSRSAACASPRWLWVATGTRCRMRSICSSEKPSAARRTRARPATSSCAQGHAVMPVAETPTMQRVPCSKATARPCSV